MLSEGQTIGTYHLLRQLGAGAFGEVWLARHAELGAECALKIPTDPDYVKQLRREGQIQFGLKHPNVVATVDLNTLHDPPYFVMEYVAGTDLRKHLTARGRLPQPEALRILSQLLDALSAAHAQGILHRDLKPENILLTGDGTVKVSDFGLGRVQADVAKSVILSGSMVSSEGKSVSGTYAYMSPEQQEGKPPEPSDDVYAVGIIGCELLTGHRPSALGASKALAKAGIAPELSAVIEKALNDPAERYRDAGEMLDAVGRLARTPPPHGMPLSPPPLPPQRQVPGVSIPAPSDPDFVVQAPPPPEDVPWDGVPVGTVPEHMRRENGAPTKGTPWYDVPAAPVPTWGRWNSTGTNALGYALWIMAAATTAVFGLLAAFVAWLDTSEAHWAGPWAVILLLLSAPAAAMSVRTYRRARSRYALECAEACLRGRDYVNGLDFARGIRRPWPDREKTPAVLAGLAEIARGAGDTARAEAFAALARKG